jgi:Haloacid dehalogenase-like hydrolase
MLCRFLPSFNPSASFQFTHQPVIHPSMGSSSLSVSQEEHHQLEESSSVVDLTLPQGVIFDFDGTILDTEGVEYTSWRDLFDRHNQPLSIETWAQCVGSDYDTWSPEKHLEDLTHQTFDWNETIHPPRCAWVQQQLESQGPRPGIRQAIQFFHDQKKIPLAVASSSSHEWVDTWLEKGSVAVFSRSCLLS